MVNNYVIYNSNDSNNIMASRSSYIVYDWWIYTYPSCSCCHFRFIKINKREKDIIVESIRASFKTKDYGGILYGKQ